MKKIFALLLLSVMISSSMLLSCGEKAETPADANATTGGEVTEAVTISEVDERSKYDPNFEKTDMGGYVFNIGTRDDASHGYPIHTRDLTSEGETGDIINDAVFRRNKAVEELFNCKIEMTTFNEKTNEQAVNDSVKKSFMAGDYSFDLVMTHMIRGATDTSNGYYCNFMTFPNIDLSKPYWSQGVIEGLSIDHKLFLALSDMGFSANESLYCIFFNKNLVRDFQVENPYTLVENNQWTFDKFAEIIKTGTADLDGDGVMTKSDQYGYVNSNAANFIWAGGSHIDIKDENDIPHMDFMTDKTINIFNKVYDIVNNAYTFKGMEWFEQDPADVFVNGRGVFYSSQLIRVNDLRAADFDFGIVPYPKWDENQKEYYAYVDGHASMMAIPQMLPHPEWTGMIIEQLSYLSYRDIIPSYYDVVLNIKMVRDDESIKMLDTLFNSKVIDFGYAYGNWDSWYIFITNIHKNNKEIVSTYEKQEAKSLKALDDIIAKMKALE